MPQPKAVIAGSAGVLLDNSWKIYVNDDTETIGNGLRDDIQELLGFELPVTKVSADETPKGKSIVLENRANGDFSTAHLQNQGVDLATEFKSGKGFGQGYALDLSSGPDGSNPLIVAQGATQIGAFYAVQTLWHLLNGSKNESNAPGPVSIPDGTIIDWPSREYRVYYHFYNEGQQAAQTYVDATQAYDVAARAAARVKLNVGGAMTSSYFFYPGISDDALRRPRALFRILRQHYLEPMILAYAWPEQCPECLTGWAIRDEVFQVDSANRLVPSAREIDIDLLSRGTETQDGPAGIQNSWTSCRVDNRQPACFRIQNSAGNGPHTGRQLALNIRSTCATNDAPCLEPGIYVVTARTRATGRITDSQTGSDQCWFDVNYTIPPVPSNGPYSRRERPPIAQAEIRRWGNLITERNIPPGTADGWHEISIPLYIDQGRRQMILSAQMRSNFTNCGNVVIEISGLKFTRLNQALRNVKPGSVTAKDSLGDIPLSTNTTGSITFRGIENPFGQPAASSAVTLSRAPNGPVHVSYNMLFDQAFKCYDFENERTKAIFRDNLNKIKQEIPDLKFVMLWMDEIRAYNREHYPGLKNSQYFANAFDFQYELVKEIFPSATMFAVADMLMPSHNAGTFRYADWEVEENWEWSYSALAKARHKDSVIFVPWWYEDDYQRIIRNSIGLLKKMGLKYAAGSQLSKANVALWNYYAKKFEYQPAAWVGFCYESFCEQHVNDNIAEYGWNDKEADSTDSLLGWFDDIKPELRDRILPNLEVCNGMDDNGDGVSDETYRTGDSPVAFLGCPFEYCTIRDDPFNCGACGNVCYSGSVGDNHACLYDSPTGMSRCGDWE